MKPPAARQRPAAEQRLGGSRGARSEQELKTTLQELVLYIVFLSVLCTLALGMVSTDMYYLNKVMAHVFLEPSSEDDRSGFRRIGSKDDFWKFAEGALLDGLYWDKWYNNRTLTLQGNNSRIYYENLLLGAARIRQLKVQNNTCPIYPYFHSFLRDCYSEYGYRVEDRSDFGLKSTSEWKYTSGSSLSLWYWGSMGWYSTGGYMFTLPKSKQESRQKLVFLRQNNWLTRGTRVVFIDFSTYNANINLFCIIRLVVEFPATGGALTSSHFYSVKLLRYVTYKDYFLASCEIAFCCFIIIFMIKEAIKMAKLKKEYFKNAWNWLELLLLVVSILAIAFNITCTVQVSLLMQELLSDAYVYPDFYFLAFWQVLYNNMIAINVFFAWIKVFKYINLNKTTSQMSSTLSHCAKDIIGFSIMFFLVFFAYAQLGYLLFGSQVEEFSTFQNSIFTQFRMVLGDFNFATIEAVNRILGPLYFITFVFFVFFILLSMFLAIINNAYSEVKAEFKMMPSQQLQITDLIKRSCHNALVKVKLKKAADESLERKEFSATKRKDISKLSDGDITKENGQEELSQNYASAEDIDSVTSQSYVSTAEFQWLLGYTHKLGMELSHANAKINNIKKTMQKLTDPSSNMARAHLVTEMA